MLVGEQEWKKILFSLLVKHHFFLTLSFAAMSLATETAVKGFTLL